MYKYIVLLGSLFGITLHADSFVEVQEISSPGLQVERQLFMNYWSAEYATQSLHQLELDEVTDFLAKTFDEEEYLYFQHLGFQIFVHAIQADKVVGYMSCDLEEDGILRIRQFALIDSSQQQIFEQMLMFIVDLMPCTLKVLMKLQNDAKQSIKIVLKLGFMQKAERVEGCLQDYKYFEMSLAKAKKHITAWLDDVTMCSSCGCGESCRCPEGGCTCSEAAIGAMAACGCGDKESDYLEAEVISVGADFCGCPDEEE